MKKLQVIVGGFVFGAAILLVGCSDQSSAHAPAGGRRGAGPTGESVSEGRAVLETADFRTLAGTLEEEGSEWYLKTDEDRYALHFGRALYLESTGIALEEGKQAEVRGLMEDDGLAVVSVELDSKRYDFRTDDGVPLWAGWGQTARGVQTKGALGDDSFAEDRPRDEGSRGTVEENESRGAEQSPTRGGGYGARDGRGNGESSQGNGRNRT